MFGIGASTSPGWLYKVTAPDRAPFFTRAKSKAEAKNDARTDKHANFASIPEQHVRAERVSN